MYLLFNGAFAQRPSFYHLTTANGLYDNHIRSLAIDSTGFLWIGTEEGLNRYDGHTVTIYLKEKYPELPANLITGLFCDAGNNMWVATMNGAARISANTRVQRVILQDTISGFAVKAIIETKKQGIVLITNKGHFYNNQQKKEWQQIPGVSDKIPFEKIRNVQSYDGNRALFVTDSAVFMYDYTAQKITHQYDEAGGLSICKLGSTEVALGKSNGEVIILDAVTGRHLGVYSLRAASANKTNTPQALEIKQAINGDLIIATGLNGLVTITRSGIISRYIHDPVNSRSLSANSTYRLATGNSGEVVVGTSTSGVSMYNTNLSQANFQGFFTDASGNYYDNYTGKMIQAGDDVIWIGAYDRLIRWQKKTNTSQFFYYLEKEGTETKRGDIRAMCLDKSGTLWLSIAAKGIAYFSEATHKFIKFTLDTLVSPVFGASAITDIIMDEKGILWVCTNKGLFTINPSTKKASASFENPLLREPGSKNIRGAFIDSRKRLWFATINSGVYCFDQLNNKLLHYTTKDGLPSDVCYMVQEDKKGRYFITTSKGLAIVQTDGVVSSFTKENGLRYDRCESVLIDHENVAWFSNKNCLVRLDPDNNKMEFFDEKAGLLNEGFRVGSCLKTKSGELLWGGYKGISYFFPGDINNRALPQRVRIYSLMMQDSTINIKANNVIKLPYTGNSISFGISAIHLGIPGRTYYQYRLNGFEPDWQKGEDIQQVRYTVLPPASYTFELKASIDGVHWTEANRKLTIIIVPPLWMRGWFIAATLLVFAGIVYWIYKTRNKKIQAQKEQANTEQAINYFASGMYEQQTTEAILWDVARNCVDRMHFEDCVIYLLDKEKKVLLPKASYGARATINLEEVKAMEVPVGKGIAGTAALTGKAAIINDTTNDQRYTADDKWRHSEIAIPMIWGDEIIGVINCVHHKKNFFKKQHLSALTTVASLCANKIIRARAEEEKQKAQITLRNTQQKMAEVEMQALRAQMNPHFIFNCLNSINRYIVKSDQATASLYLTRFAKLIRLILDNSGSRQVLLSNELDALKLYIEMEALRFDKKFSYEIIVDRQLNTDSIELPPLIIQPYVENAIWHGLLHKDGAGRLTVTINRAGEGMLECTIKDDGIGRSKAKELKSKSATSRKSSGMQLTQSRLDLLNRHAALNASISIVDMENENKQPAGTKVILLIPV